MIRRAGRCVFFLILKVLLFCFYTTKLLRFCQLCPTPLAGEFYRPKKRSFAFSRSVQRLAPSRYLSGMIGGNGDSLKTYLPKQGSRFSAAAVSGWSSTSLLRVWILLPATCDHSSIITRGIGSRVSCAICIASACCQIWSCSLNVRYFVGILPSFLPVCPGRALPAINV